MSAPESKSGNGTASHRRILIRRLYSSRTGEITQLSVYCPEQGRCLKVEECAVCSRCLGFSLDPTWRNSFLMCQPEGAGPEPAPGPSPEHTLTLPGCTVAEIMTRDVVCVTPDLDVGSLISLFLQRGISGAPVVDEDSRPIGMVSKTDLVRFIDDRRVSHHDPPAGGLELRPLLDARRLSNTQVADIMMPLTFVLRAETHVQRAAALMAEEGVHRLAVVSASGEVVGLISTLDVLRWLARASRPQEAVAEEARAL